MGKRDEHRSMQIEVEMQAEMGEHIALLTERNLAAGMSPAEARRAALVAFGPLEAIQEEARASRAFALPADLWRDLRFAARMLRQSRGFTAVVLLTLSLGIGACAAILSIVDGVLLRPLPYPEPERLVMLRETLHPRFPEFAVAPREYFAWKRQATAFESLSAMHVGSYNLTIDDEPTRVSAGRVTANTFATLGVSPARGRGFTQDEDVPGKHQVAILAHEFWQRRFAGRPDVLGRAITLDGRPFTVVGIMPPGFQLDGPLDLFTPAAYEASGVHDVAVIGRLAGGVTFRQAENEMALVAKRLEKDHPGWGVKLTPLLAFRTREARPILLALAAGVVFLFLVACINVASLLLVRATVRARELAVRAALGASAARLARQLLAEAVLLVVAAGLLGTLLAHLGTDALLALAPADLPRAQEISVHGRALAAAWLLALLTVISFGVAPALRAARLDLREALSGERGPSGSGAGPRRLRDALVVAEVAIAVVLLVGAGLLVRSFLQLRAVDAGFHPQGALAATLTLPTARYGKGADVAAFAERAVERLEAIPGLQSPSAVGAAQGIPFAGVVNHVFPLEVAGEPRGSDPPVAHAFAVTPGYFPAMQMRLLRGRLFDTRDAAGGAPVTIVNEALARKIFPGEDPIGKRLGAAGSGRWHEIVGVVADVKYDRLDGGASLQAYAPMGQGASDWGALTFVLRPRQGPPPDAAIRAAIRAVDANQAIASIRPVDAWLAGSMARQRFTALLFAVFAGAALFLAALGLHGLLAYTVTLRRQEIGIRMALGARAGQVVALVMARAGRLVALGLALGVMGALILTRALAGLLFGTSAHDPLTFGVIAAVLAAVAALACLLPAARAIRVDPMSTLRGP